MGAKIKNFSGQTMRSIGTATWVAGGRAVFKVPQDIIGKEIIACGLGKGAATFAGAVPKLRPLGFLDGMIKTVTVSRNGTDKVKSFSRTRKSKHNNRQVFGESCPNLYQVNSATLTDALHGVATFGTTGQQTAFAEALVVAMFENKLSSSYMNTLFDTRNLQTAVVELEFGSLADIQDPDNVATVATFAADCEIELFISCADYLLDSALPQNDWVEKSQTEIFNGAVDRLKRAYYPEGEVQGVLISILKTGNKPLNHAEMSTVKIELEFDGTKVFEGNMLQLAQFNNCKNMKQLIEKGSFYYNFLHNSTYGSGLPTGSGRTAKPIEIYWTIPAAIGACEAIMEYDLIIAPKVSEAPVK